MIADIYNTALYNKILEATDKGQIVVLKYIYGYQVLINTIWYVGPYIGTDGGNIYPEESATNLYVPTTLTAVTPSQGAS